MAIFDGIVDRTIQNEHIPSFMSHHDVSAAEYTIFSF